MSEKRVPTLEARLERLPGDRIAPGGRGKMQQFVRDFDRLWRVGSGSGETYCVEEDLRELLRRNLPAGSEAAVIAGLRGLPDSRLLTRAEVKARGSRLRPAGWDEVLKRVTGRTTPPSGSDRPPAQSMADVRSMVAREAPELARGPVLSDGRLVDVYRELLRLLPKGGRDAARAPAGDMAEPVAEGGQAASQTSQWDRFWFCFLVTLGFFMAIAVLAVAMLVFLEVFLVGAALAPTLWSALVALLLFLGFSLIVTLHSCLCDAFRLC